MLPKWGVVWQTKEFLRDRRSAPAVAYGWKNLLYVATMLSWALGRLRSWPSLPLAHMLANFAPPGLVLWGAFSFAARHETAAVAADPAPSKFRRSTDETNQIYCIVSDPILQSLLARRRHGAEGHPNPGVCRPDDCPAGGAQEPGYPHCRRFKNQHRLFHQRAGSHGLWPCGGYTGSSRIRHPGLSAFPHRGIFFPLYFY